uniref:Ctr_72_TN conopeptide n=1 Tax=Conus tribblei TaxID=101761 RepID=A0A0C9RYK2_CONTD
MSKLAIVLLVFLLLQLATNQHHPDERAVRLAKNLKKFRSLAMGRRKDACNGTEDCEEDDDCDGCECVEVNAEGKCMEVTPPGR